ncbi:MAG TPA: hypothetical protein PLP25_11790, partial [Candidatus Limiplasma sp.]|nr:hypothetical protein [Candidatus Limiplasma sp.]
RLPLVFPFCTPPFGSTDVRCPIIPDVRMETTAFGEKKKSVAKTFKLVLTRARGSGILCTDKPLKNSVK